MCLEGPQVEISIERVLAPGSGRDGAARVGACVAGAAHLSRALAVGPYTRPFSSST